MGLAQPRKVLVVGAGGHARVVLEILLLRGEEFEVVGLTDPEPAKRGTAVLGVTVLGGDEMAPELRKSGVSAAIVATGDNRKRSALAEMLRASGFELVNAIHPAAVVSRYCRLGHGVALMAGAVINAETLVGDDSIVNTNASVDHNCDIAADVHIAPAAALGGSVRVGRGAFVGLGVRVIPGVQIGEWSTVGAGAVVIRDVPPGAVQAGVPARPLAKGGAV